MYTHTHVVIRTVSTRAHICGVCVCICNCICICRCVYVHAHVYVYACIGVHGLGGSNPNPFVNGWLYLLHLLHREEYEKALDSNKSVDYTDLISMAGGFSPEMHPIMTIASVF